MNLGVDGGGDPIRTVGRNEDYMYQGSYRGCCLKTPNLAQTGGRARLDQPCSGEAARMCEASRALPSFASFCSRNMCRDDFSWVWTDPFSGTNNYSA